MWETIESLIEAADQGDAKAQTELAELLKKHLKKS